MFVSNDARLLWRLTMQYALPIDGYASEYNDDIEFFVACYQHTDDPLQSFIRREIEVASGNYDPFPLDDTLYYPADYSPF